MRLRWRLRTLMLAVAVVGVLSALYAGIERRRSRLRRLAQDHWQMAAANSVVHVHPSASRRKRRLALYHVDLANKSAAAARYPWLPVAPDPPPPE